MKLISRNDAKELNLKLFYTGKHCKHGHDSERYVSDGKCSQCVKNRVRTWSKNNPELKKQGDAKYYEDNKGKILIQSKTYRDENKDKVSESKRKSVAKNPEKYKALGKAWKKNNPGKVKASNNKNAESNVRRSAIYYRTNKIRILANAKVYRENNKDKLNSYYRDRRNSDVNFKLSTYTRNMVGRVLNMSGGCKTNSTTELLGYDHLDLKSHIESLFTGSMSWENYGEWHIDHVIPIIVMINNGVTDPKIINALSNLQPLWAVDNLSKGAKL